MLKLQLSKKAQKFLSAVPAKHQKQLALKIMDLKQYGHVNDTVSLKGGTWYRVDVGEYRIIYTIEEQQLLIISLIGKRNDDDVYKKFRRLS
jgi:mRNA interferase RelE/StbE